MESLGLRQKPRCWLPKKAPIRRSFAFLSLSLSLSSLCPFLFLSRLDSAAFRLPFHRVATPPPATYRGCGTNRRIGKLLRKEVGYTRGNEEPRL